MGEAAGAGAELAPEAAGAGAGKGAGAAGEAVAPLAGEAASGAFGAAGPEAGGIAAGASPFVIDSPIAAGSLDYLNGAAPLAGDAAGASPLVTADASLNTGASPFAGSGIHGSNSAGQPFAAGGTTAVSGGGASIDPGAVAGSSPQLAAPAAGPGATSLAPAGSTAGAAAPADATSSWADMLKKGLTANPLGTAIAAGGLGYNILQGQKTTANQGALTQAAQKSADTSAKATDAGIAQVTANQNNAAEINAQAKGLEQYLTTGQLPPQYTQQIDQAINDAKTTAISNAAKNGQPTDPTKNTALAQQLAQIDGQRAGMTSKIAETLFNAGSGLTSTAANVGNASASSLLSGGQNAANLSGQLYTTLTGIDSKQSEQTAKAIAALAQSLNSGGTQKAAA